jgi:hypothetical protein
MIRTLIVFIFLAVLGGCATTPLHVVDSLDEPSYNTDEYFRLRLFFGLSKPDGTAVSLSDWESFQNNVIAKQFDGFNIVDSIGFYKGQPEPSKILTLILNKTEIRKAEKIAQIYAERFDQESVMMVAVPVLKWDFIGK